MSTIHYDEFVRVSFPNTGYRTEVQFEFDTASGPDLLNGQAAVMYTEGDYSKPTQVHVNSRRPAGERIWANTGEQYALYEKWGDDWYTFPVTLDRQ